MGIDVDYLGKKEIAQKFHCGNTKALNMLKLMCQMNYAVKLGKSFYVTEENLNKFLDDMRGKEVII